PKTFPRSRGADRLSMGTLAAWSLTIRRPGRRPAVRFQLSENPAPILLRQFTTDNRKLIGAAQQAMLPFAPRKDVLSRSERRLLLSPFAPRKGVLSRSERRLMRHGLGAQFLTAFGNNEIG